MKAILKSKKRSPRIPKWEAIKLPDDLDYLHMDGLALEARQKLHDIHPRTLSQASRISGVNPADIAILLMVIKRRENL